MLVGCLFPSSELPFIPSILLSRPILSAHSNIPSILLQSYCKEPMASLSHITCKLPMLPRHLIVFTTCPEQKTLLTHQLFRIISLIPPHADVWECFVFVLSEMLSATYPPN